MKFKGLSLSGQGLKDVYFITTKSPFLNWGL